MRRRTGVPLLLAAAIAAAREPLYAEGPATHSISGDQAIAVGYMLDSPRPLSVITKSLAIAEGLRRRYGIDTGHPVADREAAARRAQAELLDRASFTAEEIDATAGALGFSLDPARCAATCDNVRRLATLELQKRLIERFVFEDATSPQASASAPVAVKPR